MVVYLFLAWITPILALIANKLIVIPAALSIVALLALWIGRGIGWGDRSAHRNTPPLQGVLPSLPMPFWLIGCFLLWATVTWSWSVQPDRPGQTLASLWCIWLGGLLFWAGLSGRRMGRAGLAGQPMLLWPFMPAVALIGGCMLALAFFTLNVFGDNRPMSFIKGETVPSYYFNGGMAVLAVLVWPAARALSRAGSTGLAWGLVGAVALCAILSESSSATMGLALGISAAVLTRWLGARIVHLCAILVPLSVLLMPVALPMIGQWTPIVEAAKSIPISHQHRLFIWSYTGAQVAERPLFGWGLDASRALGNEPVRRTFHEMSPDRPIVLTVEPLPLHPHNAALQTALELGAVGVILLVLVIWSIWRGIARAARSEQGRYGYLSDTPWLAGMTISALSVSLTAFGAWQSWWLVCLAIGVGLVRLSDHATPAGNT